MATQAVVHADLWQCPRCGAKLVSPNMSHSCGVFELEPLFARSEPQVWDLFQRFAGVICDHCESAIIVPQKTRVVFQSEVRFAGAIPRKSYLHCHFVLTREIASPRFLKVEEFSSHCFLYQFKITAVEQFDQELINWLHEAYVEYGQRQYLKRNKRAKSANSSDL